MKKLAVGILTAALVFGVGTISVLAAESGRGRNFIDQNNDGVCDYVHGSCSFVDEDGDGVCDYDHSSCSFVDEDGDGVCDYGHGSCSFVDEDGDGVCDYVHASCSFVDEDEDGVCDNCEDSICRKTQREKSCGNKENRGHHSSGHGHRSGSSKRSYGRHH